MHGRRQMKTKLERGQIYGCEKIYIYIYMFDLNLVRVVYCMGYKTIFDLNIINLNRFPPEGDKKPFDSVQYAVDDSNRCCAGKGNHVTSKLFLQCYW